MNNNGDQQRSERLKEWESELSSRLVAEEKWSVFCYKEVPSTMDSARELLDQAAPGSPVLILTESQTSGRGRQGRSWESVSSGLYYTAVFAHQGALRDVSGFTLVVGCALYDLLKSFDCAVGLRWPNDVLSLDKRKLCGVLVESVSRGDLQYVITGVGINLVGTPGNVPDAVAMIDLCGREHSTIEVAAQLSRGLFDAWQRFLEDGFAAFRQDWLSHALHIDQPVQIDDGTKLLNGIFRGVSESGALLLERGDELQEITAGYVQFCGHEKEGVS